MTAIENQTLDILCSYLTTHIYFLVFSSVAFYNFSLIPDAEVLVVVQDVINEFPPLQVIYEPPHDKTNKMACVPSEDSDQPGHPPSLCYALSG